MSAILPPVGLPDFFPGEGRMPRRPGPGEGRPIGDDEFAPGRPFPGLPDFPGRPRPEKPKDGRPKPPEMDDVDIFLSNAYLRNLDRQIDDEGKKYWGDEIRSGRASKEDVVSNIRRSDEYGGVVEKFLTDAYRTNLGRDADTEGFDYWANELKSGKMDRDQVYSAIKGSKEAQEYRKTRPPERELVRPMPMDPVDRETPKPKIESPTGITAVKAVIDRDNENRSDMEKQGLRNSAALLGRVFGSR